jgi:hypothetical protein
MVRVGGGGGRRWKAGGAGTRRRRRAAAGNGEPLGGGATIVCTWRRQEMGKFPRACLIDSTYFIPWDSHTGK